MSRKSFEKLLDTMSHIVMPGVEYPFEWEEEWQANNCVRLTLVSKDILEIGEEFHRQGLFSNEDALTNSIRFIICELMADAISWWQEEIEECPVEADDAFRALWDACQEEHNAQVIPWSVYNKAMAGMYNLPEIWGDICHDICISGCERYRIQIDYTITDRGHDCQIDVSIGGAWQDMDAVHGAVIIGRGKDLRDALGAILPSYMLEGLR